MKLNLGCGTKKLEGYTNVDLCDGADVQCDITNLPKEWEGQVEEIIAIHSFEHLSFAQANKALVAWKAMLKPGGRLIIECPNLKEVCLNFVKEPDNLTMGWGALYGPQWEDESDLMVHKSGWTPQFLADALSTAGYRQITQTRAHFHKREPRDFRMEAIK